MSGNSPPPESQSLPTEHRRLLPVFAIGVTSILVLIVISIVAYGGALTEIRKLAAEKNLLLGKSVANLALPDVRRSADTVLLPEDLRDVALERMRRTWPKIQAPYDDTYLCVIGSDGLLKWHSTKSEMVGTDVGGVTLTPSTGQSVRSLLASKSSWSGENMNFRGNQQLVGYHYEPSLDALVAVHVPSAVVESRFRSALLPWVVIGVILGGGFVLPTSLTLLYSYSRRATKLATSNMRALLESEKEARELASELGLREERHRGFAENSSEGIYLCEFDDPMPIDLPEDEQIRRLTTDCHFAFCNDSFAKMYGYDRGSDMHGLRAIDTYGTHDNEANVAFLRKMVRNNYRVSDVESEEFDRDGNPIVFSNNCLGIVESGHLIRVWGTQQDITDKRRAEQLIRLENVVLQRITDGQHLPETLSDTVDLIETQSPSLIASFWTLDESAHCLRHAASKRIPNDVIDDIDPCAIDGSSLCAEAVRRGHQVVVENTATDPLWSEKREFAKMHELGSCTSTPIKNHDGVILGTLSVARRESGQWSTYDRKLIDIGTQLAAVAIMRQRVETALRESENRFRTVFERAAVGVAVVNSVTGAILSANPRYCQILGTDESDLIGKTWMDVTADEDIDEDASQMERLRSGEIRSFQLEKRLRRSDGRCVWINLSVSAMWRPDEKPSTHIAIIEDIDARRSAENELSEHRETIAHMTRLSTMGEMVAGLAHEVKQPLYTISNFTTAASVLLAKLEQEFGTQTEWLQELQEWNCGTRDASHRASEIIDRLRDFTRKRDGSRHLVDLNQVVRESMRLVAFEARKCNAKLVPNLDHNVPKVMADRIECEQVLVNLLQNAFDAVGAVDHQRQITITTHAANGLAEVSVQDNGPGIDGEINGKLFDAFFTTKNEGMGMGLAISRTIVEDHGGRLWAQNGQADGAAFHFTLPAANGSQH